MIADPEEDASKRTVNRERVLSGGKVHCNRGGDTLNRCSGTYGYSDVLKSALGLFSTVGQSPIILNSFVNFEFDRGKVCHRRSGRFWEKRFAPLSKTLRMNGLHGNMCGSSTCYWITIHW